MKIKPFWIAFFVCILRQNNQQTIIVNNSTLINYQHNSSNCNILTSQNVSAQMRCLILCQTILCESLKFDFDSKNCTLIGGQPQLIEYHSLPGMNLTYNLTSFISYGQSCLFNFTCYAQSCLNGICCSFNQLK